jgi:hypothetical protein
MTSMTSVVYGDGQIIICGGSMRIGPLRMLDRKRPCSEVCSAHAHPEVAQYPPKWGLFHRKWQNHVNGRGPVRPYFFSRTFCFPYFSPLIFFSYFFVSYYFPVFFSPVLFCSRTFSKVATFEIQRFKISVSCFSSTCRYNTVHVHCGTSIQTSPVGFPLDGWGARMRDLKGPTMNLFNLKEDWNVLLYQPIISLEIEPIRSRHCRPISQSDCKNWTNQKRADL